jgi:hypothetical protein
MNQFKRAVQLIDPLISKKELRRYIEWVFEPQKIYITTNNEGTSLKPYQNIKSIKQIQTRDFEEIILRLERCSCFMHGTET